MVPPYKGWGWQTSTAWVASGAPWFSSASRRPAGPLRKKDLMAVGTLFSITAISIQHSAISQPYSPQRAAKQYSPRRTRRAQRNSIESLDFFLCDLRVLRGE